MYPQIKPNRIKIKYSLEYFKKKIAEYPTCHVLEFLKRLCPKSEIQDRE